MVGIDFSEEISGKVDRLLLKTMPGHRRRRKITGGKTAVISQSVEGNAFHLGLGNALRTTRSTFQHGCISM
jgi:hypothetical protein